MHCKNIEGSCSGTVCITHCGSAARMLYEGRPREGGALVWEVPTEAGRGAQYCIASTGQVHLCRVNGTPALQGYNHPHY